MNSGRYRGNATELDGAGAPWFNGLKAADWPKLSEALGIARGAWTGALAASVSRSLRNLERRGLLVRLRRLTRRRTELVHLTPAGKAALDRIDRAANTKVA